ncbi:hypothetical protein F1880_002701 [Penicillium rolfsii]|nr:hypothetical protein F1880_002701 [Penicillium rolfsii]
MADPLSTASSAIGVISLSLQIAQQLITFCHAYQSYDEDAKRIKSKAESLRLSLRTLRDLIEDAQVSNPDLAEDLSEKALGMQHMVNRLRKRFERHLPTIADGFPEKIRGQIKRIVYPFRRDEVKEMFEDLDGIQNALQTTLSM